MAETHKASVFQYFNLCRLNGEIDFKIIDENSLPVTGGGTVYVYNSLGNMQQKTIRTGGTVGGTTEAFILTPGQWTYDVHFADQTKYTDINGRSLTVNDYDRKTVTVQIGTIPQTGSLTVYSIPSGADIYIDNVLQGQTPRTVSDILEGSHTVRLTKADFEDNETIVSITAGTTDTLSRELVPLNSDDDDMTDPEEREYYDQNGVRRSSDPTKADTDNDGNDDGVEAGTLIVTKDGHTIWKITGDALKTDTDGDGASDYVEYALYGTDPLTVPMEQAPEIIAHQTISIHTDNIHLKTYCRMGAAFGETGIKDGSMNWLVGDNVASSIPYFAGWMASGYVVVGDIRDIGETIYQGDGTGTALNAFAFAPYVGDAGKTGNSLRKLATKYPNKITEMGTYLIRTLPESVPESVKISILTHGFSGREAEIISELRNAGKSDTEIATMVRSKDGLKISSHVERILNYNSNIWIDEAHHFSASKDTTILGKWIENDVNSFEKVGDAMGANVYYTKPGMPEELRKITNLDFLDIARNNGKIKLCSDPTKEIGDTAFKRELDYLISKGWAYDVIPHTEIHNGKSYTIWYMEKVL